MKILFVADGRSPIALNWIEYFLAGKYEVHLASTFTCSVDARLASFHLVPVAFSGMKKGAVTRPQGAGGSSLSSGVRRRTLIRQWLGPLTLPFSAHKLAALIEAVQPDMVHAMRIPFEGILAARSKPTMPLLVSIWGNDFTLHARSTPWLARLTRRTLHRLDALHTDCRRDALLAQAWGFDVAKPYTVLPGAGGVQMDLFYPPLQGTQDPRRERTVINPRGFRHYIRNDVFFRAIPTVLSELPETRFLCPNMAGETLAERKVAELGIQKNVELLPPQPRPDMAELFRQSAVAVSPSTHDGTPNTLLEALACGCFPVAGDLESLREWITSGQNGLLIDPNDPQALAQAILRALKEPALRHSAQAENLRLVAEKAEYKTVMSQAEGFYHVLSGS